MTSGHGPIGPRSLGRRRLLGAIAASPLLAACQTPLEAPERGPIAAAFFGRIDDGGFHEQGYRGLLQIRDELKIPIQSIERINTDRESMLTALRALAHTEAAMIIAHGGAASAAIQRVAWEIPDKRFTLIQGDLLRPNLAVYRVRSEESAWLAGAAAALMTRTGVVGHVSAQPDDEMFALHAAFAAGARSANAKVRVIDPPAREMNRAIELGRVVSAQLDARADLLFLSRTPPDAIDATWDVSRRRGARLIGQGRDWVAARPDAFVASAVADTGEAIVQLGRDLFDSMWRGDLVRSFGLRYPDMVRLTIAAEVPANIVATLDDLRGQVAAGRMPISDRDRKLDAAPR
jgi:basic membrane protein A and related proteins